MNLARLKTYIAFLLSGIIGGGALPALLYGFSNRTVVNGMVIGVAVSLTLAAVERSRLTEAFRRMPFVRILLARTAIQITVVTFYVVVFILGLRMIREAESIIEVYRLPDIQHFLFGGDLLYIILYAITVLFLINLVRQMSRMLGQNVLLNMVIGKYARPLEEERIILFLDLDASTTLAERLGNIRYHELLDDYIYDITPSIVETGGEIYQYVGDEIVVTWKVDPRHRTNNRCLDCFFKIDSLMDSVAPKYVEKYGEALGYKAGIHCGTVIAGVIGDVKKEIVYQGDVVNTASRIKEKCHSLGAKILVSGDLLEKLPKNLTTFRTERVGLFLLKGKEHEVELFGIMPA